MNVERLKTLIGRLIEWEDSLKIQDRVAELNNALTNMANALQEAGRQIDVSTKLSTLEETLSRLDYDFAESKLLGEVGALEFFSTDIVTTIRQRIAENPMTPAVVQQEVGEYMKERKLYLSRLRALQETLTAIGIVSEELSEGSAEIGFQIPRHLFDNTLDGLVKELGAVKRIIRAFSEAATGHTEPIEVRQISTSDPLFLLGLDPLTISAIAGAVTWALNTWKQVENIRKIRAETRKLDSFTEEEVEKIFGDKIKKTIEAEIEKKTTALIGARDGKASRKEEQRNDLSWALEAILARVERGMTIEIRLLAPPQPEETTENAGAEPSGAQVDVFRNLEQLKHQLVFPAPEADPILALPPAEPKGKADGKGKQAT